MTRARERRREKTKKKSLCSQRKRGRKLGEKQRSMKTFFWHFSSFRTSKKNSLFHAFSLLFSNSILGFLSTYRSLLPCPSSSLCHGDLGRFAFCVQETIFSFPPSPNSTPHSCDHNMTIDFLYHASNPPIFSICLISLPFTFLPLISVHPVN